MTERLSGATARTLGGLVWVALLTARHCLTLLPDMDLPVPDEAMYLNWGRHFFDARPPAEWGPLYCLWYWMLGRVIHDPIHLFYVSWSLLIGANLLVLWLLLQRSRLPVPASMLALILISQARAFDAPPFVPLMASAMMGGGLLIALQWSSAAGGVAVLATAAAVGLFARPELGVAFGVLLIASVVLGVRAGDGPMILLRRASPAVATALLFGALLGNPFASGRLLFAFLQHYQVNLVHAHRLSVNPWYGDMEVARATFGHPTSVLGAALHNPGAFLWHVGRNLAAIPESLQEIVEPIFVAPHRALVLYELVMGGLLLVGCLAASRVATDARPAVAVVLRLLGAIAIVQVPVILIIHPRAYYFIGLLCPALTLSFLGWARLFGQRLSGIPARALVAVSIALALIPLAAGFATPSDRPIHDSALAARALPLRLHSAPRVIDQDGRSIFIGWNEQWLLPGECFPVDVCLRTKPPDVLVVTPLVLAYYGERGDQTLERVIADPKPWGYSSFKVPEAWILVRGDEALEQRAAGTTRKRG